MASEGACMSLFPSADAEFDQGAVTEQGLPWLERTSAMLR
jgi:hypothetical protein